MTPVEFRFLTPTGNPISNALIEIQLTKGVIEDLYPGVVMPRLITATTDMLGTAVVNLYPADIPYMVSVYDSESDAGLFYKFFVPELAAGVTQVRLQDIIVDREMSNTSYDEAALLSIHNAKANAIAASTAAQGFAEAAQAASLASQGVLAQVITLASDTQAAKNLVVTKTQEAQTSATASAQSATASAGSATVASIKATEASASSTLAQSWATQATGEVVAGQGYSAKKYSQDAAGSATAAATSASNASTSATTATTKATDAAASADLASTKATAASASAMTAESSATQAIASATQASTSATNAAASASLASTKATAADTSATYANTQATAAAASATAALGSQNVASTKASEAATSATNSANSATASQTSANSAATSASNAASSATAAATQATNAATSATAAAGSATSASISAGNAAGSAASALSIYGNTTAMQTAVAQAAAQASLAAGHAASASSVVQQDLSGVSAAALHRSPNAVTAMFVYDTSKDSDGGAWTEKCQHTSWYNEAINGKWLGAQVSEAAARAVSGATTGDYFQMTTDGKFYKLNATSGTTEVFRGNKQEFPKLSAIVAETNNNGSNRIVIYDLTEPNRPMWMVAASTANNYNFYSFVPGVVPSTSVSALNGIVAIGFSGIADRYGYLRIAKFASDSMQTYSNGSNKISSVGIAKRNTTEVGFTIEYAPVGSVAPGIANGMVNAVAMTVLPDATVDPVTGLQVPTIAVATAGGVSVIKHDGVVANIGTANNQRGISLIGKSMYVEGVFSTSYSSWLADDLSKGSAATLTTRNSARVSNTTSLNVASAVSSSGALASIRETGGFAISRFNRENTNKDLIVHVTSGFNTGYMMGPWYSSTPGTRRAYLCDIDAGSVSGTELVTNGTFDTDLSGWTNTSTGTGSATYSGGAAALVGTDASNRGMLTQQVSVTAGKVYRVTYTVSRTSGAMGAGFVASQGTVPTTTYETASGTFSYLLTAPANNCYFAATTHAGGGNVSIDNISIKEVVVDRSYKSKTATITGTLTKSPVA